MKENDLKAKLVGEQQLKDLLKVVEPFRLSWDLNPRQFAFVLESMGASYRLAAKDGDGSRGDY